jgi:hypothetical protein
MTVEALAGDGFREYVCAKEVSQNRNKGDELVFICLLKVEEFGVEVSTALRVLGIGHRHDLGLIVGMEGNWPGVVNVEMVEEVGSPSHVVQILACCVLFRTVAFVIDECHNQQQLLMERQCPMKDRPVSRSVLNNASV